MINRSKQLGLKVYQIYNKNNISNKMWLKSLIRSFQKWTNNQNEENDDNFMELYNTQRENNEN